MAFAEKSAQTGISWAHLLSTNDPRESAKRTSIRSNRRDCKYILLAAAPNT
jgi:hypothetical protein